MAEVWEGRDEVLNRPVAVKMLLAHLAADPYLQERFRREAVTAARLVHPGIVAIFDAGVEVLDGTDVGSGSLLPGTWPGRPPTGPTLPDGSSTAFIVMELVPGETLRDLIARAAPLHPALAIAIAAQMTDALAYAHAQGLVHRDIKPANVLLRDEGGEMVRVKVADFGIAKAAATAGGDLTLSGTVLGTPKYLSPEQVQGKEPDARADLYSLGVVLFEMLVGRPPFQESTDMATALAHVQNPVPDLAQLVPDLPPGLGALVASLLAKAPSQRPPSALVVGAALAKARAAMATGPDLRSDPGGYLHIGPAAPGRPVGDSSRPATSPTVVAELAAVTLAGTAVGGSTVVDRSTAVGAPSAPAREQGAEPVPASTGRAARRRRSGRLTSVFVGALLVGGLLVAVVLTYTSGTAPGTDILGGGGGGGHSGAPTPVQVLSVHELTQDGNLPNDNVGELPNLISSSSSGYWESDIYTGAEFGGSGGFGLVLQLNGPHDLDKLVVTTPMKDWSAEAFTAGTDGSVLRDWGSPLSPRAHIYGSTSFSLAGRRASWVLFWMIDPGPARRAVVDKLTVN
jgi:hypothetical protein